MSLYTGETCLICNKVFKEDDDVAACPECGTPYHRSCYKEKKHCVNDALHASHGSWMAESFIKKSADSSYNHICAKCGCPNLPDADSCRMCGTLLSDEKQSANSGESEKNSLFSDDSEFDEYFGFDETETMDSEDTVTLGEMADYVKSNKLFYMFVFKKLKEANAKISLNLIAFLFPEYYFAGRKMYGWAAIALLVSFILYIPNSLVQTNDLLQIADFPYGKMILNYFTEHPVDRVLALRCIYIHTAFRFVAGLAANGLYYRNIIGHLKKIRSSCSDNNLYRRRIKSEGGVSYIAMLILLLSRFLLGSCAGALFILIVAYS